MQKNTAVLPTTYFGNIEYYSILLKHENIIIEAHEHYVKQTFRNRCVIATANGPMTLSVPVNYSNTLKTKTKDVTIDYSKNWQKQHFKAIESAYRKSPFYEFYIDDFMFVFEKKEKYLLDLNMKILDMIRELIKIKLDIKKTSYFKLDSYLTGKLETTSEKEKIYTATPYLQTFSSKFGFTPNLCLIDLLFNTGSNYKQFIRNLE